MGWSLGVALAAALAAAEVPPAEPLEKPAEPPRNYWLPAVEVLALEAGLQTYDRLVLRSDFAQVSGASIRENLRAGWFIDGDPLLGNYLSHPYNGTLIFNAARSSGFGFWGSTPFVLASSVLWEYAGEIQHPSINDLICTTVAGSLWGESLHRMAGLLLDGPSPPGWARWAGAVVLDPLGSLNRQLLGPPAPGGAVRWDGRFFAGGLTLFEPGAPRPQLLLGADFDYGFPGEGAAGTLHALEHFDLHLDVGFGGTTTYDASLRGALWGVQASSEGWSRAMVLFGLHDASTGPGFRVADVALGPGGLLEGRLSETARLRATLAVAGILIGGAGSVEQTDSPTPADAVNAPPRYSAGPGGQGLLDLQLLGRAGFVRLVGRSWWIAAIKPTSGLERVNLLSLGGGLALFRGNLLGAEGAFQQRLPARAGDPAQSGWEVRLTWQLSAGGV